MVESKTEFENTLKFKEDKQLTHSYTFHEFVVVLLNISLPQIKKLKKLSY